MQNPVVKVPLTVMNVEGRLHILGSQGAPTTNNGGDNNSGGAPPPPPTGPNSAQLIHDGRQLMIYVKSMHSDLNGKIDLVAAAQTANKLWMIQQFNRVVDNQRRFGGTIQQALSRQDPRQNALRQEHATAEAAQGVRRTTATATGQSGRTVTMMTPELGTGISPNARLMERPRNLHEMWQEFLNGWGTNKPARSFNKQERNSRVSGLKQKFYRRKFVWRVQCYMVDSGYTIEDANAKIINVYGTCQVTQLIGKIKKDARNKEFPQLSEPRGFHINPQLHVAAM